MPLRPRAVFLLASVTIIGFGERVEAAPIRPFFEPTDLEFEKPGILDIDVQIGPTYGLGAWGHRWFLTDLELDFGWYDNVEFDLDAAFTSDLQGDGSRIIASEALWPTMKVGFADFHP